MDELSKVALEVLFEDFRARWQELLNIEAEINTWAITYITALFLTIAWVLGRKNGGTFLRFFKKQRVFIISFALINAGYMLMLSAKDNRLQQNALYIYEVLAPRITKVSGETFNLWEQWRRQNTLTWGRTIYNLLIILPTISISAYLFTMYAYIERPWQRRRRLNLHNFYFYFVLIFNLTALILAAINMKGISDRWGTAIREHEAKTSATVSPSLKVQVASQGALKALRKIDAATEVGVDIATYNSLLVDVKVSVDEAVNLLPDGKLKEEFKRAIEAYMDAKKAWELSLKSEDHLLTSSPEVQTWGKKYSINVDTNAIHQIYRDDMLKTIWKSAQTYISSISTQIKQ